MTASFLDIGEAFANRLQKRLPKAAPSASEVSAGGTAKTDAGSVWLAQDCGRVKSRNRREKLDPQQFDLTAFSEKAERVAAKGGSDFDIARALKVDETTLMIWLNSHPHLRTAVEKGRVRWQQRLRRLKRPPCPRCGGFVDETIELFGDAFSIIKRVPRCLICGKRFYWTMTPVPPRAFTGRKR